jgi:6-phosphofructokinase 1
MEAADKIRDTADSHNRLFFIEVMGRHAGFIALHSAIGAGAGGVLIPENDFTIESLVKDLKKSQARGKHFGLIVIAEGNKYGGAAEVARLVKEKIDGFDTKVSVIGHLQRGGSPTCLDRVLASRLGYEAVECLMRGQFGCMVGISNNQLSYTSFEESITKFKTVNADLMRMVQILAL